MSTLTFSNKGCQAPEKEEAFKDGKRIGVIRLTGSEVVFRVDPGKTGRAVSKVQEDAPVELSVEELTEITEHVKTWRS